MGAFDSPFSDIDNTKEGHVYVVNDNGWGWFALFVLAALPFFILSLFLKKYAVVICQHPLIACLIYGSIALVVSFFLNRNQERAGRFTSVVATFVTLIPFAVIQAMYAIPYIMIHDKLFVVAFEWLFVTAASLGITIFMIAIGKAIRIKFLYLMIALALTAAVLFFISPPDSMTWADVIQLYCI